MNTEPLLSLHRSPLFLLLLSACSLTAGGKARPQVRFLAERAPTPVVQVVAIAGEKHPVDFDLPVNYLSRPIEVPGRSFQLRRKQPDTVIASIRLPEAGDAFVSLLVPAQRGGYNAIVIPTDEGGLKPGSIYLYNHSDETVAGCIGTSKFVISAGQGQILEPEGGAEGKFHDVVFSVRQDTANRVFGTTRQRHESALKVDSTRSNKQRDRSIMDCIDLRRLTTPTGKGPILEAERTRDKKLCDVIFGAQQRAGDHVFSTTRWPADNRMRSYVFFFRDTATGLMEYRAVDEFVPPATPQTQADP